MRAIRTQVLRRSWNAPSRHQEPLIQSFTARFYPFQLRTPGQYFSYSGQPPRTTELRLETIQVYSIEEGVGTAVLCSEKSPLQVIEIYGCESGTGGYLTCVNVSERAKLCPTAAILEHSVFF